MPGAVPGCGEDAGGAAAADLGAGMGPAGWGRSSLDAVGARMVRMRWPDMPEAAIASGCIDYILSPEEIAATITTITHLQSTAHYRPKWVFDDATFDRTAAASDDPRS